MGPRKAVVSRPKRKSVRVNEERRTKQRQEEEGQSSEAPSRALPPLSMSNRPVTTGRKVMFDFLEGEHFRIGQWLKNQGWEKFCSLNVVTYPKLVKEFFEKMRIGTSQVFSTVKGIEVVLDERRISNLLEMPNAGICRPRIGDRLEYFKCILEREEVSNVKNLQANQLSVEMRLLHNIVSRIIFPKTGRFDWVTEKDMSVMFNLINGNQMNLPFIVLDQIKESARRARACLPYGMMFTLIFKEFKVNLTGEQGRSLVHTDFYNERSLHRMGYKKINDRWTKKVSGQEAGRASDSEDDEAEDHEAPQTEAPPPASPRTPPPPPPVAPSTVDVSEIGNQIFERIECLFTNFKVELFNKQKELEERLETQHASLKEEMQDIEARLDEMERKQGLQPDISEIKTEASKAANKVEDLLISQQGGFGLMYSALGKMESQLNLLISRTSTSTHTPRAPAPHFRPPFSSTVRPGAGFPSVPTHASSSRRSTTKPSSSTTPIIEFPDDD